MKKVFLSTIIIFLLSCSIIDGRKYYFSATSALTIFNDDTVELESTLFRHSLREGVITKREGNTVTIELEAIEDQADSQKKLIVVELLPKQEFKTIKTKAL